MKLLAIDGNSIINRAFYGIRMLTTKDGRHTNAIYGFINILNRLIEKENPDGVAVAFDLRAPTFRHKMYSEYKAGRKPMPEELAEQFPVLKLLLQYLGYCCIELEGYEADDILGTLAAICEKTDDLCVISTGDRDSLQLVSDKTKVLLASTRAGSPEIINCTTEYILEKYGVEPSQMLDIKALQGDASDNIPGVAGIGEKTARELISKYGSIDSVYQDIDTIDIKEGVRLKLKMGRESAFLSRTLGEICKTVPIDNDILSYKIKQRQTEELASLLKNLEFYKLMERMGIDPNITAKNEDNQELRSIKHMEAAEFFMAAKKIGICDIVISNNMAGLCCNLFTTSVNLDERDFINFLQDEDIAKRVWDSKWLWKNTLQEGINMKKVVFDASLAAYLINPSSASYDVQRLFSEYCTAINTSDLCELEAHAAQHSAVCDAIEILLEKTNQLQLLSTMEIPFARVLAKMELCGFMVDAQGLKAYGASLGEQISELVKDIYSLVGYEFNINSPKQLGIALFEDLKLPFGKKTKTGYSTNMDVLDGLRDTHPVVVLLIKYRKLAKLKSTYCDSLADLCDSSGRIHSTFNQTETRTGRISSSEPNLQNIPVRSSEGKELRKFFKAADGYILCDADYSQIELRVLAHISGDSEMIKAFRDNIDIHTLTASQVFNMPPIMVTSLMRSRAKAVNFGIVYGIGAFSLSKDIDVSVSEAKEYINKYFNTYLQVARYMEQTVNDAKACGYAITMFNRRRPLPEISSSNGNLRAFGERVARNMPIQGTAADIIKLAMIKVDARLEKELPQARLIMQVHDELIVEAEEGSASMAAMILKEEMMNAVKLKVELPVDALVGKTWYDAKG